MNRKDLIEGVAMLLEDAAGLTSAGQARNLSEILGKLKIAAKLRASAIKFRNEGKIQSAMRFEEQSQAIFTDLLA